MNYLSTDEDRKVAAQGLKIVRKIMLMKLKHLKNMNLKNIDQVFILHDNEELVKAGSDYTQTIFHPVGTCKMGQDDNGSSG